MMQTSKSMSTTIEEDVIQSGEEVADDARVFEGTDVPVKKLFYYLEKGYNLHIFLDYFPSVSREQAVEEIEKRVRENASGVVHSRKDTMSGLPVFKGTRVPVKNLFDYLAAGDNLDEFLCGFPSVSREQAVKVLDMAKEALESYAYESASR
jgi:uncharacterized protein (DUF433 family)